MLTTTILKLEDLTGILDAIYAYNRLPQHVIGFEFYDSKGDVVEIQAVGVIAEGLTLAVRQEPEQNESERGRLMKLLYPDVGDPYKVPSALGLDELAALATKGLVP